MFCFNKTLKPATKTCNNIFEGLMKILVKEVF